MRSDAEIQAKIEELKQRLASAEKSLADYAVENNAINPKILAHIIALRGQISMLESMWMDINQKAFLEFLQDEYLKDVEVELKLAKKDGEDTYHLHKKRIETLNEIKALRFTLGELEDL